MGAPLAPSSKPNAATPKGTTPHLPNLPIPNLAPLPKLPPLPGPLHTPQQDHDTLLQLLTGGFQ